MYRRLINKYYSIDSIDLYCLNNTTEHVRIYRPRISKKCFDPELF